MRKYRIYTLYIGKHNMISYIDFVYDSRESSFLQILKYNKFILNYGKYNISFIMLHCFISHEM